MLHLEYPLNSTVIASIEETGLGGTAATATATEIPTASRCFTRIGLTYHADDIHQDDTFVRIRPAFVPDYRWSPHGVLDELLMTQSSYQPANLPIPVVGGFGVMNCDGELNDARESLFAPLILEYGQKLDCPEYKERGLAALRAGFSMMYCPENPEAKVQWEATWPFFNEKDYGFTMENYGHSGKAGDGGIGIGEFTIYDWSNGSASEAWETVLDRNLLQ